MASKNDRLFLHEEVLLLALRDDKGTVVSGTMYSFAMAGAALTELLLEQRIEMEEGKKKLISVISDKPLGDPILDECLSQIATAKRRARMQTWVQRLANLKNLRHRTAEGLVRRRILRADEDTILLIFKRKIYPELDPGPERRLIERLEKAVFTETPRVDPRTAVLVSLANSAGLLKIPFDKKKLRTRKARIERLTDGSLTGHATREAIQAAQTAAAMAAIIPAVTVAATAGH